MKRDDPFGPEASKKFQERYKLNRRNRRASIGIGTEAVPQMAEFYSRENEYFASPKEARDEVIARAKNMEGHDAMTEKAMAAIKRSKLQADAKAPGAGPYAKSRAKLNEVTGFKKGGSTASKRADGCATKGKTKGRFV